MSTVDEDGINNEFAKLGLVKPKKDPRMKTKDVQRIRYLEWPDLHLSREVQMGIYEKGWEHPSPIQEEAITPMMMGRHVLARAKNGTGKTGSYVIPIVDRIDTTKPKNQAIIVLPTRELAKQVFHCIRDIAKHKPDVSILLLVGGQPLEHYISVVGHLMNPESSSHIVVGTPGRILAFLQNQRRVKDPNEEEIPYLDVSECNRLVMDEADKLLSDNTKMRETMEDMLEIVNKEKCKIGLFSATFPASMESFMNKYMKENCDKTNLMDELTLHGVSQYYAYVKENQKIQCLHTLFKKLQITQSIIFTNTVTRAELLAKMIVKGLKASCFYMHAKMPMEVRNMVFDKFCRGDGSVRHLVCTDLFARGIDIQAVNVVINFDFPKMTETYLHRIGRSGRFGHYGIAINMITYDDRKNLMKIEDELDIEIKAIPDHIDDSLYVGQYQHDPENFIHDVHTHNTKKTEGISTKTDSPKIEDIKDTVTTKGQPPLPQRVTTSDDKPGYEKDTVVEPIVQTSN